MKKIIDKKIMKYIDKFFIDILEIENWDFIKTVIKTFYQMDKTNTILFFVCIGIILLEWLCFIGWLIIKVIMG